MTRKTPDKKVRLNITMPETLYEELRALAFEKRKSLNAIILKKLTLPGVAEEIEEAILKRDSIGHKTLEDALQVAHNTGDREAKVELLSSIFSRRTEEIVDLRKKVAKGTEYWQDELERRKAKLKELMDEED